MVSSHSMLKYSNKAAKLQPPLVQCNFAKMKRLVQGFMIWEIAEMFRPSTFFTQTARCSFFERAHMATQSDVMSRTEL